jgi:hypothetical protein
VHLAATKALVAYVLRLWVNPGDQAGGFYRAAAANSTVMTEKAA